MGPTRTVLKVGVLVGTILCIGYLEEAVAQIRSPVTALEAASVQLTILIPDNHQTNSASFISIRHVKGTGLDQSEVVFLMGDGPRVKDVYKSRLTVSLADRRVLMLLRNVSAADAGTYRCFISSSMAAISNCEQLLIIVRRPKPPTVKASQSSTSIVGSNLHLLCEPHSTSLPLNHGLPSEIFWYDQHGKNMKLSSTHQRIHVNAENELVIEKLQRADRDVKVYCTTADNTGDAATRTLSEPSDVFEVMPEYQPALGDVKITPDIDDDITIRRGIGHLVTYKCQTECVPACQAVWRYRPYGGAAGFGEVRNLVDRTLLSFHVNRINEGLYQCQVQNKHGAIHRGFYLEALYITNPTVHINGQEQARVLEDSRVDLSCVFDSNPGPVVTWRSPSKTILSSQMAAGPQEKLASSGIHVRSFTSSYSLEHLKCEDSGVYRCDGKNNISTLEGRAHLMVMCPPSSADLPGLNLLSEYVWDIAQHLVINFVIRAVPEPSIARIMSSVKGNSRKEEIPRDFVISTSRNHDGKPHLTKFVLTSRRNLDMSDTDRVFTATIESSEFTKDFRFTIRPRGTPREVSNLTATEVGHDSLTLFWVPGFNGGEAQTFTVQLQAQQGPSQYTEEGPWTVALENITDLPVGSWVVVRVRSLTGSTHYIVRVTAVNKLGATITEIRVTTADWPHEALGSGAIIGIVVFVIIVFAAIAVVIYFLVYKRKCGQTGDDQEETAEERQDSMNPEQTDSLLREDKLRHIQEASDSGVGDDTGDNSDATDLISSPTCEVSGKDQYPSPVRVKDEFPGDPEMETRERQELKER